MYSDTWHFLNQEAYLIGACLGNGLTAIRKAPSRGNGEWYTAFFQLSVGFERLMKAIIVVDHLNRGKLPELTEKTLKHKYGHDLLALLDHVGQISVETQPNPVSVMDKAGTGYQILQFLNRFAKTSRYHNLSSLTGSTAANDPLAEWGSILERILKEDVPERIKKRLLAQSKTIGELVGLMSTVIAHDLNQSFMSVDEFIGQPGLHDKAAAYAVCHILDVGRPLEKVLDELTFIGLTSPQVGPALVPHMWEHMHFLRESKGGEIRKRRRWGVV